MRITQEGYQVQDHEEVYEILWRYYNDEVSEAEPHLTIAMDVPVGFKMWKKRDECWHECWRRNEENRKK